MSTAGLYQAVIRGAWLIIFLPFVFLAEGCTEFQQALERVIGDHTAGLPTDGPNEEPDSGGPDDRENVTVRLTVSNNSPRASGGLSEEVILNCNLTGENTEGLTLEFRGPLDRLDVRRGTAPSLTASFIVDQADVGQAFVYTCVATGPAGTVAESEEETIIPTQ